MYSLQRNTNITIKNYTSKIYIYHKTNACKLQGFNPKAYPFRVFLDFLLFLIGYRRVKLNSPEPLAQKKKKKKKKKLYCFNMFLIRA
jgi:hypothetical protein